VGLEAIFLQMSASTAQIADVDHGAIFHLVSRVLVPETLVTELIIHPIPWAVNGLLYASDVT